MFPELLMCGALMCLPSPVWWRHETSAFLVGQANNSEMASGFLGTPVGEGHKKVFGGLDSDRLPWWLRWEASSCNVGDQSSIPGLGRSPGEGNGNPLQYSCLGKSHVQRSLVGYIPWGRKGLDTTERLHFHPSGKVPVCVACVAGRGGQSRALHGSIMEEHWRMRMFPWVPARRYDASKDGLLALWYHTNSLELEENQN